MDLRQSKEFAQYMKSLGWMVEKIDSCYIYLRKLPFLPPLIMKVQYPNPPISFVKIEKLAQKHKPLQIQIQPLKMEPGFKKHGYKLGGGGHVTKTLQIDLTQSEKKIFFQMKKDARYGIRKAKKETIQIIEVKDLKRFQRAWRTIWLRQQFVPSLKNLKKLKKAFGKKVVFLATQYQKKIIAGVIILMTDKNAYYYRAFTSKEGRKKYAQYLLVWEAIKLAKKKGCKIFDFEGIYDKRFPVKSWKGFSHFKKSFGGKEIEYPGCYRKFKLL